MPVALITAADGVYHPTLAALIIGRQRPPTGPTSTGVTTTNFKPYEDKII